MSFLSSGTLTLDEASTSWEDSMIQRNFGFSIEYRDLLLDDEEEDNEEEACTGESGAIESDEGDTDGDDRGGVDAEHSLDTMST